MSYSFRAGWNYSSILVLLESCMSYTIAECTVNKEICYNNSHTFVLPAHSSMYTICLITFYQ